jgi:hypothetical protein
MQIWNLDIPFASCVMFNRLWTLQVVLDVRPRNCNGFLSLFPLTIADKSFLLFSFDSKGIFREVLRFRPKLVSFL